ncbi:unnamed protein product [Ectocarpus sp. 12 AP-2014]
MPNSFTSRSEQRAAVSCVWVADGSRHKDAIPLTGRPDRTRTATFLSLPLIPQLASQGGLENVLQPIRTHVAASSAPIDQT